MAYYLFIKYLIRLEYWEFISFLPLLILISFNYKKQFFVYQKEDGKLLKNPLQLLISYTYAHY